MSGSPYYLLKAGSGEVVYWQITVGVIDYWNNSFEAEKKISDNDLWDQVIFVLGAKTRLLHTPSNCIPPQKYIEKN